LIFSLHFIGTQKFTEGLNPLVVGGLVLLIGASLGGTTGYAINPARDLGPRLAHFLLPIKGKGSSDWAYAPIPILGPILGSFLGSALYKMLYLNEMLPKYWVVLAIVAVILVYAILKDLKIKE
jgi:glycerol uptake facilitator protein